MDEKLKRIYIIAGPNGAGKTTFAFDFLPNEGKCLEFINADMIAHGLSPLNPSSMDFQAGKLMLRRIEDCIRHSESFAFETTLSGIGYARKIIEWKKVGYKIIIFYFSLPSVDLAISRVKIRVSRGGHDIPTPIINRRFMRSWKNFNNLYKPISDSWVVIDTSGVNPLVVEESK